MLGVVRRLVEGLRDVARGVGSPVVRRALARGRDVRGPVALQNYAGVVREAPLLRLTRFLLGYGGGSYNLGPNSHRGRTHLLDLGGIALLAARRFSETGWHVLTHAWPLNCFMVNAGVLSSADVLGARGELILPLVHSRSRPRRHKLMVREILAANEGAVRAWEMVHRHNHVHIIEIARWRHFGERVRPHIIVRHLNPDVLQNTLRGDLSVVHSLLA